MTKYLVLLFLGLILLVPSSSAESQITSCSQWMHDHPYYQRNGPDGLNYASHHAQIDHPNWCHFHHEHGTNPVDLIPGYVPVFGYVGDRAGFNEPHEGYKGFGFNDRNGHIWYITLHMGSSGLGRACQAFHSVSVYIADAATFEALVDIHFMADFGYSETNTTQIPLTPTACPNQYAEAIDRGSGSRRQLPVEPTLAAYEPWLLANWDNVLGFAPGNITFNTFNPMVGCNDIVCDVAVNMNETGEKRHLTMRQGTGFYNIPNTGEFFTDPYGVELLTGTETDAVRQYIKPGLTQLEHGIPHFVNDRCFWRDPWSFIYICGPIPFHVSSARSGNLAGGLQAPN
jgi:hypothetical protein